MTDKSSPRMDIVGMICAGALLIAAFAINASANSPLDMFFSLDAALQEKIAAIEAQYPKEAVLYRGQDICGDGCLRSRLLSAEHDTFTVVSSKGTRQLSIGNGTAERAVVFAQCVTSDVHVFGLDTRGRVYVIYPTTPSGFTRHCIIDNNYYTAVALTGGRLVFIA